MCYLLSLPCDEVPNSFAKEGCQEGVKWGWLLQEGIQDFQEWLLITQLIIDHSHITCQQLTCYIWIPVVNGMDIYCSKMMEEQNYCYIFHFKEKQNKIKLSGQDFHWFAGNQAIK